MKFVFSLLSVSDEFLSKYYTKSNNNELVLPITTFQRHISTYSASEVEPVIFINSAKKEVHGVYTVFNRPILTIQPAYSAATGGSGGTPAYSPVQYPRFLKGSTDGHQACSRFIHKY